MKRFWFSWKESSKLYQTYSLCTEPRMVERQFTYCHLCEQRCGLAVTTEGNKVQKIEPDKDNTYSWRDFCIFWNVRRSTLSFNQSRLNHSHQAAARPSRLSLRRLNFTGHARSCARPRSAETPKTQCPAPQKRPRTALVRRKQDFRPSERLAMRCPPLQRRPKILTAQLSQDRLKAASRRLNW